MMRRIFWSCMIALSFTRTAEDIDDLWKLMGLKGSDRKIIVKIENQDGMHNYNELWTSWLQVGIWYGDPS